jgi:signal transduction histidine kinase
MNLTDEELIEELNNRFAQSRKAFSDLSVVNRKLVEMNQRLEQSESLKSNFLSNIRNEINNPLNAIIGLAGQLTSAGENGSEVAKVASMICSEANVLDFQLRNIFMAAELEAGEVDPHLARANVLAVVTEVVESFRHNADRKAVKIMLDSPATDALSQFATDAEKLQIIVSNLVANAVEFSHKRSNIEILLTIGPDDNLVVAVQDHGLGIAEDDQKRIFDRFIQLETGSTRSHLGHGLGLSIAKALVDLLQGTISVASAPGTGALFTITIPQGPVSVDDNTFAEGGNMFLFDVMSEK